MENFILMMVIATLPVFALLYYFWHRDKGEKEPMKLMRKVFFWGVAVIVPVGFIEAGIDTLAFDLFGQPPLFYFLIMPFIFVALPEEFAKFLVVKKVAYDHHKFNEIMDGITYAVLASMGFAILENIMYTINYGLEVGLLRAFTAVPAHALFSGIMGYYIGLAKFQKNKKLEKKLLKQGLFAAVFFHGLYDFLLMSNVFLLAILIFPLIGYMATILHNAINQAHKGSMKKIEYI